MEGQSPMQLLDMVADQGLTSSLAKYTFESQMACIGFCERQILEGKKENEQLSIESTKALEKQCNKQCLKKFLKSYTLFNKMMKDVPQGTPQRQQQQ